MSYKPIADHSLGTFNFFHKEGAPHAGELFSTKEKISEEFARIYANTYRLDFKRV